MNTKKIIGRLENINSIEKPS